MTFAKAVDIDTGGDLSNEGLIQSQQDISIRARNIDSNLARAGGIVTPGQHTVHGGGDAPRGTRHKHSGGGKGPRGGPGAPRPGAPPGGGESTKRGKGRGGERGESGG